jgi:hypothetical protein
VTAIDYDDALALIDKKIFYKIKRPNIKKVIENIDIRQLDHGHVMPNMNPPSIRDTKSP